MSDETVIRFHAGVYKVQTLIDGGLRVTLDLPETAISEATKLMECKRGGAVLEVAAVPIEEKRRGREKPRESETKRNTSATY